MCVAWWWRGWVCWGSYSHAIPIPTPTQIPAERHRIESSGGLLVYLHGSKPFLRGGDFAERQSRGERSMQLNYSRAFGGLFLKPFGLSATPDITQVELTAKDKCVFR